MLFVSASEKGYSDVRAGIGKIQGRRFRLPL